MKRRIGCICIVLFIIGYSVGYKRYYHDIYALDSKIHAALTSCETYIRPSPQYFRCMKKAFSHIVNPGTLTEIMRFLEYTIGDLSPKNESQRTIWCHDIGHIVGDMVSGSGASLSTLISACGSGRTCGYGCIHGVVVGMARRDKTFFQKIHNLCDGEIQCYHGFGHAYAELSGYDMSKSLAGCQAIDDAQGPQGCAAGVFMELFQPPVNNHVIPYALVENELRACMDIPDIFRKDCALRVGESVAQLNMSDAAIQQCVTTNVVSTKDCIAGFIQGSIDPVNDPDGEMAIRACEALSDEYKTYCFAHIGSLLAARYGQDAAVSVCINAWTDERRNICLQGAYEKNYDN